VRQAKHYISRSGADIPKKRIGLPLIPLQARGRVAIASWTVADDLSLYVLRSCSSRRGMRLK